MSWLKGALEKAKVKGALVKELAVDVVNRTRDMKARLMGQVSASELEVQLQSKSEAVKTCRDCGELCRWILWHLDEETNDVIRWYKDAGTGSERYLSFTQVLLRSKCFEFLLTSICNNSVLLEQISRGWMHIESQSTDVEIEEDVAATYLFRVLQRMANPSSLNEGSNLLSLLFSSAKDSTMCETVASVVEVFSSSVKRNWHEEYLLMEMRDLVTIPVERNNSDETDSFKKLEDCKVRLISIERLHANVKDQVSVFRESADSGSRLFNDIQSVVELNKKNAEIQIQTSVVNESEVRKEKQSVDLEYSAKMEVVMSRRSEIDSTICDLEAEKRRLKMELERVCAGLDATCKDQRKCMLEEQSLREEICRAELGFVDLVQKESSKQSSAQAALLTNSALQQCMGSIKTEFDKYHDQHASEAMRSLDKCNAQLLECIQEHMEVCLELAHQCSERVMCLTGLDGALAQESTDSAKTKSLELEKVALSKISSEVDALLLKHHSTVKASRFVTQLVDELMGVLGNTERILNSDNLEARLSETDVSDTRQPEIRQSEPVISLSLKSLPQVDSECTTRAQGSPSASAFLDEPLNEGVF